METRTGLRSNQIVRTVARSSVVLDASGGDSFTDLYGDARFRAITLPKQLALRLGRPLVLMPQTYGPFASEQKERLARDLVSKATLAFARDPDSFANLKALLGHQFDSDRHREGVDLAFELPTLIPEIARAFPFAGLDGRPTIGINVSGLIANQADEAESRFGIACDYLDLLENLVLRLLNSSDARIVFIPHVYAPKGHYESDQDAIARLLARLSNRHTDPEQRISAINCQLNACELKWIVSQMDWFCGTRMHSTIAALSSGVPAAALAYSLKTRGVFAKVGLADAVIDLRHTDQDDALAQLLQLWEQREHSASILRKKLPAVREASSLQLDHIAQLASQQTRISA